MPEQNKNKKKAQIAEPLKENAPVLKVDLGSDLLSTVSSEKSTVDVRSNSPTITQEQKSDSPDKADEVFLHCCKRAAAFFIDLLRSSMNTLGLVWVVPILMAAVECINGDAAESSGKKAMALRITDVRGGAVSEKRLNIRSLLKYLIVSFVLYAVLLSRSPFPLLLLVTYQRRTLYDWIVGTRVLGREKDPQSAFYPRANYVLFFALIGLLLISHYFRFSVGHKMINIVEPLAPGLLQPIRSALAGYEIGSVNLESFSSLDYKRLDRLADLQQMQEKPGFLSLNSLLTLVRGYRIASQERDSKQMTHYASLILKYPRVDVDRAFAQTRDYLSEDSDATMTRLLSDVGDIKAGAFLLEEMIKAGSNRSVQDRFTNDLINNLYRGEQWRPDAVRLRAMVIARFVESDYRAHWNLCRETCEQQIYDLRELGREVEAQKLDREIKQIEKKLRAEHEREKMRAL